jgi:uncharacterized protein YbjT (DUF2867 family)
MSEGKQSCAILGASGMVGARLLELALSESRYSVVRTLARRPLDVTHERLEQRVIDLDRLADERDSLAVDDVFCCLGTTIKKAGSQEAFRKVDYEYPLAAARTALAAGAKQYLVITAVGADANSSFFYNRVKGELEDALRELRFAEGITSLHPSILLGDRQESRPGEAVGAAVMRATRFLFAGSLMRYRAIDAIDLARAMLRAAQQPKAGYRVLEGRDLFALL